MVNRPMEIDGVKYFKCKKCGEVKPLNKCYFHINTMFITGFSSKCKSCVKEERESKPKVKYITRAELEEENKKLKKDLAETQKIGESWRQECKQLREDVDYFRQCYLDLKKLCEKEGFMLSDEEVTKMFNLDKIK